MANRGDQPIRTDQSNWPGHRVPSRRGERSKWDRRKIAILQCAEQGMSSYQIAHELILTPETVRSNYQRLYNELGLPKGQRNTVSMMRAVYARGWLPCPCGHTKLGEGETIP